ncbi:ThuA domain-containing protein [Haloferula sp.]|uniref:ThuA domain-containing protein n=1 Tax=Haloferula sp. TaxID=2497595 RepID=UPI00329D703C
MSILRKLSCLFLLLFPMSQVVGAEDAPLEKKLRILITDGFGNHDWKATTEDIKAILKTDPSIQCEVSTVPKEKSKEWEKWLPPFSDYDLIIQNTTDIRVGESWPEPAQRALESYVSGGGGLYIFHSANNAFPEWKEYNLMIGLGWRDKDFGPAIQIVDGKKVVIPAGQGAGTGHGKRLDTVITRINDHPIHQGLPEKWMAADLEIYRYARGPAENMTVISYALEPKTKMNFPIEWVIQYGKGRVYNSTYGHHMHKQEGTPAGIRCVAFRTICIRACHWLAGVEVPSTVPETYPTTEAISLSP